MMFGHRTPTGQSGNRCGAAIGSVDLLLWYNMVIFRIRGECAGILADNSRACKLEALQ